MTLAQAITDMPKNIYDMLRLYNIFVSGQVEKAEFGLKIASFSVVL